MFWVFALCIGISFRDASGDFANYMSNTITLCCNEGRDFARNHSAEECSISKPIPADIPQAFGSFCILTRSQCCKEYFQKKHTCDTGIDIATSSQHCELTKDLNKLCCDLCMKGTEAGLSKGAEACVSTASQEDAETQLSGDAFVQCCKKAVREKREQERNSSPKTTLSINRKSDTVASVCEDYAPNELCAHHCIPLPGSFKCECNPGFMLMTDGRNCKEVEKNRCLPHNPCQHKCNDNGIAVMCSCRRGYELMPDGKSCQDIDECQLDIPVCLPKTECHNVQGSYKCLPKKETSNTDKGKCPPGYARNVINNVCDDINECLLPNPPCPSYLCENTMGAYKCGGISGDPVNLASVPKTPVEDSCPPGFHLGEQGECEDVDECATHKDDCNKQSQFCINTHSSFYCQDKASKHCPPGFKIDSFTDKCEDIDECEDGEACQDDQFCVNQLGQYDCRPKVSCPDGMRIKPGTAVCQDINECVEGTHLCDLYQSCLNTNGSYECHCKLGYELDTTTGACVDVNECATGQHDCISGSQRCDNTVGSFLCIRITSCGTGYILHHSTGKCEDIDECAIGTHNCARAGPEYQCINIPGSFRCVRKRVSTTSTTTTTTPEPEWEYYYDSEEETDSNNASSVPSKPTEISTSTSTTSTSPPTPPSEEPTPPQTSSTSTTTAIPPVEPETLPDDRLNTIDYNPSPDEDVKKGETVTESTDISYSEPKSSNDDQETYFTIPSDPIPEVNKETTLDKKPEETETPILQPEVTSAEPAVTYKFEETNEIVPEISARPTESIPEQKPDEPDISNSIDSIPVTTYNPSPEPTIPFNSVFAGIDTNAITVPEQKKAEDTNLVEKEASKDKWNKNDIKPIDCLQGFELDDYGACFDIDECATNRHSCSGLTEICENTMGGYLCECAPGFRRDLLTGACDIMTTSSSTTTSTTTEIPTTTTERARSYFWGYPEYKPDNNRPFRPTNLCDAGYHLNSKTGKCEDINECVNGQANCAVVEICVNTEGGYRCECPPNWKLDEVRHRCMPVRNINRIPSIYKTVFTTPPPEVRPVTIPEKPSTDFVGPEVLPVDQGAVFKCRWGYKLGLDNTCEDIDECATGEAKCGPMQLCTNHPGGYKCSCPEGHNLVADHVCEDVDECSLAGGMPICSPHADCINTVGSYRCKCHKGFRAAPVNDKVCVDVDECTESRAGSLCEQRCNNVWGSFRCSCHKGYRLNTDNRTCSDINECQELKPNIPCVGRCLNEPGSYRCSCPSGYRLSEDKRSCIDIDECETGEASCKNGMVGGTSHICFNTRGSYRCQRIICPAGYQLESNHRCTKVERVCRPGDWECAHQPTTISYNYITFVSKLYIPDAMVKLFTMRGPAWPHVRMRFELRLVDVNAPPHVKNPADITYFLLLQQNNEAVMSLVKTLEGPQSIELELSMELHSGDQFGGKALAKVFIFVSEYEF